MGRAPVAWRDMQTKVRAIQSRALAILKLPRVPRAARDEATEIVALTTEILSGNG